MNKPSETVFKEFYKIANPLSIANSNLSTSLSWCEKKGVWGVLGYEYTIGSYWIAFILIDRKRK